MNKTNAFDLKQNKIYMSSKYILHVYGGLIDLNNFRFKIEITDHSQFLLRTFLVPRHRILNTKLRTWSTRLGGWLFIKP